MSEDSNKRVLDRELSSTEVKLDRQMTELLKASQDLINYGTDLVLRAFDQSKRDILATVTIMHLLKGSIAHFDSITELAKEGADFSLPIIVRAIIESSFYLEYIFISDSERKARCLYVSSLINEFEWNSYLNKKNEWFVQLFENSEIEALDFDEKLTENSIERNKEIKNHLEKYFKEEYKEFENFKIKKGYYPNNWYQIFDGPKNLRELCKKINREPEYSITFSSLSNKAHGRDLKKSVEVTEPGYGRVIQIRTSSKVKENLLQAFTFLLRYYKLITDKYLPSELNHLSTRYKEKWFAHFPKEKE